MVSRELDEICDEYYRLDPKLRLHFAYETFHELADASVASLSSEFRSKQNVNQHIRFFAENNMVQKRYEGRNIIIEPTPIGRVAAGWLKRARTIGVAHQGWLEPMPGPICRESSSQHRSTRSFFPIIRLNSAASSSLPDASSPSSHMFEATAAATGSGCMPFFFQYLASSSTSAIAAS